MFNSIHPPAVSVNRNILLTFLVFSELNKLQVFRNKILRIITELPRATPTETSHEQTDMEIIKSYVSRLAWKLYLKSQFSDNLQIGQLGQYNPMHDKHKETHGLLTDCANKVNHLNPVCE
jgi:hypothetical protein